MATISSPGIGSGMDITGIVTKLSDLERQPLVQLKKQAGSLLSRLSVYGQVKSQMASLQDAAAKLSSSSAWSQTKVNSANNAAVTATATGNAMPIVAGAVEVFSFPPTWYFTATAASSCVLYITPGEGL